MVYVFSTIHSLIILIIFSSECQEVNTTTTNSTITKGTNETTSRMAADALRDIAYYLRAHKFNEYDRRYETDPEKAERRYFQDFPRPPLRSLHWEVHKYCEPSFQQCIEYLKKRIKYTASKRIDDTATVMQEQKWSFPNNSAQIEQIDDECKKQKRIDDKLADPFEGPLERFQWRVTASYYMCWYTMNRIPDMENFFESCDNFANCLDSNLGPNNHDRRANDNETFRCNKLDLCARYSFCPDPCCPLKHLTQMESCWNLPDNPCFRSNPAGQRECSFNSSQNTEFSDIILNRWNVTCRCPMRGYEWNSRYGICIDVNECASKTHNCRRESEACINLPGSFRCVCKWGHIWSEKENKCLPSAPLTLIKLGRHEHITEKNETGNFLDKIKNLFRRNSLASIGNQVVTLTNFLYILVFCVFASNVDLLSMIRLFCCMWF